MRVTRTKRRAITAKSMGGMADAPPGRVGAQRKSAKVGKALLGWRIVRSRIVHDEQKAIKKPGTKAGLWGFHGAEGGT